MKRLEIASVEAESRRGTGASAPLPIHLNLRGNTAVSPQPPERTFVGEVTACYDES